MTDIVRITVIKRILSSERFWRRANLLAAVVNLSFAALFFAAGGPATTIVMAAAVGLLGLWAYRVLR